MARAFHVSLVAGPAGTWRAAWTVMRVIRDGITCMEKLGVCPEAVWKCLGRWMARDGVDGAVAGRWGASQSHVSLLFDVGLGLRLKGSGERTSNFIV